MPLQGHLDLGLAAETLEEQNIPQPIPDEWKGAVVPIAQERIKKSPRLAARVGRFLGDNEIFVGGQLADNVTHLEGVFDVHDQLKVEAIVQRVGRPPLLIQDDHVVIDDADDPLADFPDGTKALIVATESSIPSVGRVEFTNYTMAWGGTGWVIGTDGPNRIVATNRHVAELVMRRTASGGGVFLRDPSQIPFSMSIDFKEEFARLAGDARSFKVIDVPYIADLTEPDVALLRIRGDDLPAPLTLADKDPEVDDLVALIGYPAWDDRNEADAMAAYFRDLYNVKRYAPGRVTQALKPGVALRHDCTSLGGNSGSPLLSLASGKVVGLHFAGLYGQYNSAVGASTLGRLLKGERPVAQLVSAAQHQESASDGVHKAAELAGREGFSDTFLGTGKLATPWPVLPADVEADLAAPADAAPERAHELRYTHFGVKFSTAHRQPRMTAVNIDGEHVVSIKRTSDKWYRDERIPLNVQLTKDDYSDLEIDRGHMVRREDPNWDDAQPAQKAPGWVSEVAHRANDDTFHYTNAAVQHGDFNSNSQRWYGLEKYVLSSAATHGFKVCVFTGPVFRDDDLEIKPGVRAPREFFKLVVMESATRGRLHATAYLLSQGDLIRQLIEARGRTEGVEGFVLGPYRTFQIAVADLADGTGYDFSHYVPFDPLEAVSPNEALHERQPVFVPIDDEAQILL